MNGFRLVGVLVVATLPLLQDVAAQPVRAPAPPARAVKIGILTAAWSPWQPYTEGFREGLADLGYVEGTNLLFVTRAARGDTDRLPVLAAELVREEPDLLYCEAPKACQAATLTIPILFSQVGDPVQLGLVSSLARPGGNMTGLANLGAPLTAKRLELFKETVPSLRRVLLTYDPGVPDEQQAVVVARTAAARLGLTLLERPITTPLEIEAGLASLDGGDRDGILVVQTGPSLNIPGRSLEVATSRRIPTMYPLSIWARWGALAAYGPDPDLQGRQLARLAARILSGTPASDLPVELPDRVQFIVNLKTARRLGVDVPRSTLLRADKVIQ